jgi:hypothetical protein
MNTRVLELHFEACWLGGGSGTVDRVQSHRREEA